MNRPLPETLDETIDRLAAALTAVPADPGFSARLAPRLDAPARGGSTWMVAAAAAIVLAAILARPERRSEVPVQQTSAHAPIAPPAPGVTNSPADEKPSSATPVVLSAAVANATPREEAHEPAAPASAIAALAPVETMKVDNLTLHDLHIAPVAVAHLDVEVLDVPQIGTAEEPAQEPKE